jgi:hypothetical protein
MPSEEAVHTSHTRYLLLESMCYILLLLLHSEENPWLSFYQLKQPEMPHSLRHTV